MDLHDELNAHGAKASGDAARDLVSVETRESLSARVRRGRRARALGGAGVVAGVMAVAVVAWAALPGGSGVFGPAGVGDVAESWTIEIDGVGDAPVADAPFVFHAGAALECEDAWTLEPGVTVHHPERAADVSATVAASVYVQTDSGDLQSPSSVWAGFESLAWDVSVSYVQPQTPHGWSIVPALVRDGEVAAVGSSSYGEGGLPGLQGASEGTYWSPLPGECGRDERPTDADGDYEVVLIVQAVGSSVIEPILTVVLPLEVMSVDYHGLAEFWGPDEGSPMPSPTPEPSTDDLTVISPAEPRAPEGDTYQAFLVPEPTVSSCTPLADRRAEGHPGYRAISYDVTIPGVQPITPHWWGGDAVAIVDDDDFDPWYLGSSAWILADEVSPGDPVSNVGWTRGSNWLEPDSDDVGLWRLLSRAGTGVQPAQSYECDWPQPIPEISGAVWLVIDGVDWDTVGLEHPYPIANYPGRDFLTWVYLGDA